MGNGDLLLRNTARGLFCEAGDFYIDPWQPVSTAIITHSHSDHARSGSTSYLCEASGQALLQERLGPDARIESLPYGESLTRNGVRVSLHPAGHMLGSAQIRLEYRGRVCVVSGDYKLEPDGVSVPFEPVRCHLFVTECTFGLPVFLWRLQAEVFQEINEWWRENAARGRTSIVFGYALGKAQRLLRGLTADHQPIFLHGAIERFLPAHQQAGVVFPSWSKAEPKLVKAAAGRGLVLAPMSAAHSPWLRSLGEVSKAFASGWMQIRGARRRYSMDRGFVLSDHVDWPGLLETIRATGAETIWATHGYTAPLVRWLREQGRDAEAVETRFLLEPEQS